MKKLVFIIRFCLIISITPHLLAQATKKIVVEHSDFFAVNQIEAPDAALLTGNVRMIHDGVVMTCNKAYYFEKENYIKAFGKEDSL